MTPFLMSLNGAQNYMLHHLNNSNRKRAKHLPLTQIGGAPVALATRRDMAMSSQFLQANKNISYIWKRINAKSDDYKIVCIWEFSCIKVLKGS